MQRNIPNQRVTLFAYDSNTSLPAINIASALAGTVSKDNGAYNAIASGAPSEDNAIRAPGFYSWLLTQSETDAVLLKFAGTSSIAGIVVIPLPLYTNDESGFFRGASGQEITLFAFNAVSGLAATGLAASMSGYISKEDGDYEDIADTTPTEDDSVKAAGYYTWDVSAMEADAIKLKFSAVCTSDINVVVIPIVLYTRTPPVAPPTGVISDDLDLVRAGIPRKDDCPVLTRIKAFITDEGVNATLEHTFRDRTGNPLDLSQTIQTSESASASEPVPDTVLLRVREFTGQNETCTRVYPVEGTIVTAESGIVRSQLPEAVYSQAGIYRLSWGFVRNGQLKLVNEGLLSVERSLFGFDTTDRPHSEGPMTINEIRMAMMDSSAVENQYLLDDVEFNDEQIILAISRPIEYFNATNPPLTIKYDTRNFPWKHAWIDGVLSQLFLMAASHYRRNKLETADAGVTASDKSKEREYLAAAELYKQQWEDFTLKKKCELNLAACVGTVGSVYSRQTGI